MSSFNASMRALEIHFKRIADMANMRREYTSLPIMQQKLDRTIGNARFLGPKDNWTEEEVATFNKLDALMMRIATKLRTN